MTTGTKIDPQDREFRRWAADQLGVSPDAPTTAARNAFCQLLRDADFVPPVEWHSAYKVLAVDANVASASVFSDPSIVRDVQDRLRAEIDEFTGEYFDLAPAERRSRWGELKVRAASFKSLSTWLDALAPGLDVRKEMTLTGPPQLFGLYEAVLRNFVLRPTEAAWHRQRFIEECQSEIGAYQYAAQQLQKHYAALAALAPDLVTQVATWSKAQQQREARRKKLRASQAQTPSHSAAAVTGEKPKGGNNYWVAIGIIVVLNILRVAMNTDTKPSDSRFDIPTYQPGQVKFKRLEEMTEEEKEQLDWRYRGLPQVPEKWNPEEESKDPSKQSIPRNESENDRIMREAQERIERMERKVKAIEALRQKLKEMGEQNSKTPQAIPDPGSIPQQPDFKIQPDAESVPKLP